MEITIHEAMPGHYVQFQFANAVEPKSRRVLRSIYGNGPYVEGWALYTQQMMSDEGFMNNSPELRLTHDEADCCGPSRTRSSTSGCKPWA